MKKLLLIALILSLIFVILNYVFQISFSSNEVDLSISFVFILLLILHLTFPFHKIWMKILVTIIPLFIIISSILIWEIFGYESRIDKTWDFEKYNIQLEHRIQITGPGNYWFIVNEKIGQKFMLKKKYERKMDYEKIERNKQFEFIVQNDTLTIMFCKDNIIEKQ